MAISKMNKLSLIASKKDEKSIEKALLWLGAVQVSDPSESGLLEKYNGLLEGCEAGESKEKYISVLNEFDSALSAIGQWRKSQKGLFKKKPVLSKSEFESLNNELKDTVDIVTEINSLVLKRNELKIKANSLSAQQKSLIPWLELALPLNFRGTSQTVSRRINIPVQYKIEELLQELDEADIVYQRIYQDKEFYYLWVIYHADNDGDALTILNKYAYSTNDFSDISVTAAEKNKELKANIAENDALQKSIAIRLEKLAENGAKIERGIDFISSRLDLLRLKEFSLQSEFTFLLEGWICESDYPKLEKALEGFEVYCEVAEPTHEDKVPVHLKNNPVVAPFEAIVEMYSYPSYWGVDPTFIMAIFYFIIFGFMLGDVIYGLMLTVGCFAGIKLIHARGTMKKMLQVFGISGISMMIAGVIMGSYFGDLPSKIYQFFGMGELGNVALLFDPMKNPIALLIVSLGIGVVHIMAGFAMNFYKLCKRGQIFDAIVDSGSWIILFMGIILFGGGTYFEAELMSSIGKYTIILGVAMLVLTQGRAEKNIVLKLFKGIYSLYDLVGYFSDILSYSRILALGLSSAVIASVVNTMATMSSPGAVGIIMMVLILLLGHVINFALNLLGTFVHTSRLQYIEFFGKFYEDGGEVFRPQNVNPKYVEILNEQ